MLLVGISQQFFAEYVLFNHSLFFSSPSVPISPQMSIHTIHAAVVRSTGPSFFSIVLASLIYSLFQHLTILAIFLQNLPFYLRRITCVSVAAPIAMFAIPGVDWVVRLLEGWMNRVKMYVLIYAGLTGEPFWVSVGKLKDGVLIDDLRGRWRF
jgi:Plasma-membrane choline transporter